MGPNRTYTVTVENVSTNYMFFESGVTTIPEGSTAAGPAHPGRSFKFSFHAGPNHKLSFATMYGFSNDGFYAPNERESAFKVRLPCGNGEGYHFSSHVVGCRYPSQPGPGPTTRITAPMKMTCSSKVGSR